MGEVRSNLLTQAMKNTKAVSHPLHWMEEFAFLHEGQCRRSPGTREKWSFKKVEWRISRFVNLDKVSLQLQDDPSSSKNKKPLVCPGEILQAFQRNFDFHISDTGWLKQQTRGQVDFGQYCLNLLISQRLGLLAVKKESNVYLRVGKHAWIMFQSHQSHWNAQVNEVAELDPHSGFGGKECPRSFTCQQHSSSEGWMVCSLT